MTAPGWRDAINHAAPRIRWDGARITCDTCDGTDHDSDTCRGYDGPAAYQRAAAMHAWNEWADVDAGTPQPPLTIYGCPDALSAVVAWIAANASACGYNPCDLQNWTTCTACESFAGEVCPGHGTCDPSRVMVAGDYPGDGGIAELVVGHPSCVMLSDIVNGDPLTPDAIRAYERHIDGYMWWTDPHGVRPTT